MMYGSSSSSCSSHSPCVSQVCGVMQRAPPSRVLLVDVSGVLEQELAGNQGALQSKVVVLNDEL